MHAPARLADGQLGARLVLRGGVRVPGLSDVLHALRARPQQALCHGASDEVEDERVTCFPGFAVCLGDRVARVTRDRARNVVTGPGAAGPRAARSAAARRRRRRRRIGGGGRGCRGRPAAAGSGSRVIATPRPQQGNTYDAGKHRRSDFRGTLEIIHCQALRLGPRRGQDTPVTGGVQQNARAREFVAKRESVTGRNRRSPRVALEPCEHLGLIARRTSPERFAQERQALVASTGAASGGYRA